MYKTKILSACLVGAGVLAAATVIGVSQLVETGEVDSSSQLSSYSTSKPLSSQETPDDPESSAAAKEAGASESAKYLISVYDDRVAVYITGHEFPFQILETRLDSLPEYDQQLLKKGIAARNDTELNQLLQDYES